MNFDLGGDGDGADNKDDNDHDDDDDVVVAAKKPAPKKKAVVKPEPGMCVLFLSWHLAVADVYLLSRGQSSRCGHQGGFSCLAHSYCCCFLSQNSLLQRKAPALKKKELNLVDDGGFRTHVDDAIQFSPLTCVFPVR